MSFISNSVILSGLVIAVSFAVLLGMALKGKNLLLCALMATLIACLASPAGYVTGLTTTFIGGGNTLFSMLFMVMLSGAFLSVVMERTGIAQRLGDSIAKIFGENMIIIALVVYAILLAFLGITISTFIFYAVAMPICRRANIPKSIPLMVYMGITAVTAAGWGTPVANNLMLSAAYGTGLYDAPLMGITCFVIGVAIIIFLCMRELKKARQNGEGYIREGEVTMLKNVETRPDSELPSLVMAIIPCVLLIAGVPILSNAAKMDPSGSAIVTQVGVGLFILLTNWKRFLGSKLDAIYEAISSPIPILVSAFAMAGYGAVVANSNFYTAVVDKLMGTGISGYVLLVIVIMFICGFTADCMSGMLVVISSLAPSLMAAGYNPAVLHRLTALTAQTFDSLPHSYMVAVNLQLYGHDIKSGYKYAFRTTVVMTVIVALIALTMALTIYA